MLILALYIKYIACSIFQQENAYFCKILTFGNDKAYKEDQDDEDKGKDKRVKIWV